MVAFIKKRSSNSNSNPDNVVKLSRRRRWFYVGIVILVGLLAWYFATVYRAYDAATVKNPSKNNSSLNSLTAPVNVLIIGIEGPNYPGGLLSDTMMVASVDTKAKTVSLLSFPRDMYVTIPGYSKDKINAAHSLGEQSGAKNNQKGQGPALLDDTIEANFGIPIHYFVRLDFDGFRKIVDALGGVDITVKNAITDPFYPNGSGGYTTFSVKTGPQHMTGETALKYARSRQTTSDFDRARRQQEIVAAIKDKVVSPTILANPKKTTELITILGKHVLTNFSARELNQVLTIAKEMKQPVIRTQVLDTSAELGLLKSTTSEAGAYIIVPAAGDNYQAVAAFIHGYMAIPRISVEKPTIELINGGTTQDTLKKLEQHLTWAGFSVTQATTPVKATRSVLVDAKQGTPDSLQFLSDRYGLTATKATPTGESSPHLLLTVASDWQKITKEASAQNLESVPSPLLVE